MLDFTRLRAAYEKVRDELLAERTADGHWVGELSSSALSTATAVSALAVVRQNVGSDKAAAAAGPPSQYDNLIQHGIAWLAKHQNPDGGFGDTDLSHSNIATTYLVVAALHLAGAACEQADLLARADRYLDAKGRLKGLRERYGIDKTFVVPIMTNLALAGLVDWQEIDPLPFELACVPQSWYRFVGMPVVSYAIPALVAIGQACYFHAPPRNPITRFVRRAAVKHSLHVLRRMQPASGGYLEATPLTSFVVMSLASVFPPHAASGRLGPSAVTAAGVIENGIRFLIDSIRPDGSWPIDTNLATWNTTLSINALAGAGEDVRSLLGIDDAAVLRARDVYMSGARKQAASQADSNVLLWLLSCQHLERHPFTGAIPGGFGWSDLSGAVPDADDTPGAALAFGALVTLDMRVPKVRDLIGNVLLSKVHGWLRTLQNRDGGWPTFCRGWGTLPFDRSGTDLTAHVLRAFAVSTQRFASAQDAYSAERLLKSFADSRSNAIRFIESKQHSDGSWSPLWFGNQDHPDEENPVYGTAKVLMAYRDLEMMEDPAAQRGIEWLLVNQNDDGGWGSGVWKPIRNPQSTIRTFTSSIEESSLAVEALLAALPLNSDPQSLTPATVAVTRGLAWLVDRVEHDEHRQPAPIGFYFAKLWYYEKLYPLIFATAALGRACVQRSVLAQRNVRDPGNAGQQPAPQPDERLQPETASSRSS